MLNIRFETTKTVTKRVDDDGLKLHFVNPKIEYELVY